MQLFRNAGGLARHMAANQGPVAATLGKFDGLHLGHRAILRQLLQAAAELGGPSLVLTFDPHPAEVLHGAPRLRVEPLRRRLQGLREMGVDACGVLRFDERLRATSARAFIDQVLEPLQVRRLVLGQNFRFGADRGGDIDLLRAWGEQRGAKILSCPAVMVQGAPASSTRVRAALHEGDLALAGRLLGRPWDHSGRVRRGRMLGQQLGFATANLGFGRYTPPMTGVFAALVALDDEPDAARPAVCNLGVRPTVKGTAPLLEAHLLDFDGDLYGRRMRVVPRLRIREERRFDSLDELRAQIGRDTERARQVLDAPLPAGEAKAGGMEP